MSDSRPADRGALPQRHSWDFAGWGEAERIENLATDQPLRHLDQPRKHLLGQWRATAICGNDITSSVLYVSALCAAQGGMLAPLVLVIVGIVLYLYRRIYEEVGSALPLNGGTYTVLLNTTGKRVAAGAACLTLLSYIATAVISASEAMSYAQHLMPGLAAFTATIVLLGLFAALNVLGVSESAVVALGIFVVHMVTLVLLVGFGAVAVVRNPELFSLNWQVPESRGIGAALFYGFAAAMLGISGFESSANFIEEQERGVFPKTLRNMWIAVIVFNPLVSLLSFGLLPLALIQAVPTDLLAQMGNEAAGQWLGQLVSVDAVLVLSGAVLTSYIGVTGLIRRMTLDRCLPQVLLRENAARGTNHWIIIGFLGFCVSILAITRGRLDTLAQVYTLAFLSVMALFAVGNMLLKRKRGRLPRATRASWPTVIVALLAVLIGLAGNVAADPGSVGVFLGYLAVTAGIVAAMFLRLQLLKVGLAASRRVVERTLAAHAWLRAAIVREVDEINSIAVVYFTDDDDVETLNRAVLYVTRNEQTNRLKVVNVYGPGSQVPADLAVRLSAIDRKYPALRIDFIAVAGEFGPPLIEGLSRRLGIPKNLMFIGTPGDRFPHRIEDLGGVRVIL